MYDWVWGWSPDIPIYFTEAGIDSEEWPRKAAGLREMATTMPADIRYVTFFTLSPTGSWPTFAITGEGADLIGRR